MAFGCFHARPVAVPDVRDHRVLENLHAECAGGARFTHAEVERVKVSVAHVDQAAGIHAGAEDFPGLRAVEQAVFPGKPAPLQFVKVAFELAHLAWLVGHVHVTLFSNRNRYRTLQHARG